MISSGRGTLDLISAFHLQLERQRRPWPASVSVFEHFHPAPAVQKSLKVESFYLALVRRL